MRYIIKEGTLAKYWNAEMTLDKWLSKNYKPYKSSKTGNMQKSTLYICSLEKEITLQQWERARLQAAIIVNKYGEDYLPIFNHIELKIKECKSKNDSLKRIENILAQNSKRSLESNLL